MSVDDLKPRARIVICQFNQDPHPVDDECQNVIDVTHSEVRKEVLVETYWKLRDHAAGYRNAKAFQRRKADWETNRRDDELHHKYMIHEFYARGVEMAARDVAEMLGVPEHEIERLDGDASSDSQGDLQGGTQA